MIVYDPYAADLRWLLLRDYEGDLGVRSSFGSFQAAVERGGPEDHGYEFDVDEQVIEAASRLRRLTRRWEALPEHHRATLTTFYGTTRRVLPEWGDLGVLILSRPLAHAEHAKSKTTRGLIPWLARLPVRPCG